MIYFQTRLIIDLDIYLEYSDRSYGINHSI